MDADYFLEIEAHFAKRRGTPFLMNAKDWALMTEWQREGVPLAVVIEALDSVFDKNEAKGAKKTVSSLSYCRHAVKELWAERRELQAGGPAGVPEEDVSGSLELLASRLADSELEAVRAVAPDVRGLTSLGSVPKIEERLMEMEESLFSLLLSDSPEAAALREEAAAVSFGGKVDEKTRQRTIEANLRRLMRSRFALPRFTLFA